MRRPLAFLVLAACSRAPQPARTRIDVRALGGSGYAVSLVVDGVEQLSETPRMLDAELGTRIGSRLPSPRFEVVICGDPATKLADLQRLAVALPRRGDYVVCLPDRANCPDACP